MKRRTLLQVGAVAGVSLAVLPLVGFAADAKLALTESNLVYLSPIRSDGTLSSCQAEVWYAMLGADVYVCTSSDSWRAKAPRLGLNETQLWVGDLGVWKRANYQSLPSVRAEASIVDDDTVVQSALQQFGYKYPGEWGTWGPRFKNGLADGSRTLLRYRLSA